MSPIARPVSRSSFRNTNSLLKSYFSTPRPQQTATPTALRSKTKPHLPAPRAFTSSATSVLRFRSTPAKMASDDDYMAFLNKANEDPNEGRAKPANSGAPQGFKAQDSGVQVPKAIADVIKNGDKFYVSDADEPFEGVALKWDEGGKGLPDEVEFARLINHPDPENAGVELQDPIDWDSNGDYADIIDAVRKAGKGNDVRVYQVPRDGARTEYWVVTTDGTGKDATLVGAKALAVES